VTAAGDAGTPRAGPPPGRRPDPLPLDPALRDPALLDGVLRAVRGAGRLIEQARRRGVVARRKQDASPVTVADRAADRLLKRDLLALLACGWLSEETADSADRLDRRRVWVVDPLDGTREFVEGVPEYAVSVALVEDGEPVLGVVRCPMADESFWAVHGQGAFRRADDGAADRRLGVRDGAVLLASRSEVARGEFAPFQEGWTIRPVGSIAYKLALVAAGEGALTLSRGPKGEWDVCAGTLLVSEAGGLATDLFGRGLIYNKPLSKTRGILAGAPGAFARARSIVDAVGASKRMRELDPPAG
jgi:myo-inositol-1(or 4)-monophosphatase